jgi:hypothetical protein
VPRLLLLLAAIAVAYILINRARSVPPHKRRAEYLKLGVGFTVFLVVVLTLAGKMHWIGAAAAGLLVLVRQLAPTLLRMFPMFAAMKTRGAIPGQGPRAGQTSTVETVILRMQLDHDSGALEGEVLRGQFQEWRLSEMDRDQLEQLYVYCREEDQDSLQLLSSYLLQRFPGETDFGERDSSPGPDSGGAMNRAEALAVLGVDENASAEDIVTAHRKLIQKLHPDRGGNDYLAAKINQAKDFLLG